MGRLGFGAGRFRTRPRGGSSGPLPEQAPALIAPSAQWTGVGDSGFAAPPVDPERTTAKPVLRLLVPPEQAFTDELLVGVYAGANNGGSLLDNMGLERVIAHYEGTSTDIAAPSFQTFADANGNPVTYFGWWVRLQRDGRDGLANLWFEAVPQDKTMQNRVIGPFAYLPSPALYDLELEVAAGAAEIAGQRYKTLPKAFAQIRLAGAQHPRITITEGGNYACPPGSTLCDVKGRITIEASAPVRIGETSNPMFDNSRRIRPPSQVHWKGENITLDFRHVIEHYWETALSGWHWFDGCKLTGGERYLLWAGTPKPAIISQWVRGSAWFTECEVTYGYNFFNNASLVRGCTATETYNDACNGAKCVVGSTFADHDSAEFKNDLEMMTVVYSGAEETATFGCTGSNQTSRTFTATCGGNSASLSLSSAIPEWNAGSNRFGAVVDWLNGLGAGFSAVLLDDTRNAAAATLPSIASAKSFPPQDVKNMPLTVTARFDLHGDWYQQGAGIALENVVIADNAAYGMVAQCIFMNQSNISDLLVINCAWNQKNALQYQSQLGQRQSHVVIAHCVLDGQVLTASPGDAYNGDAYCLVANNVASDLWGGDADIAVSSNHLFAGAVGVTLGPSIDTTFGGTSLSLFTDGAKGDFTPRGELMANLKTPVVRFDLSRAARGPRAPAGALAG